MHYVATLWVGEGWRGYTGVDHTQTAYFGAVYFSIKSKTSRTLQIYS